MSAALSCREGGRREGGRVLWGVGERPDVPRVTTLAPQAVRAAAVSQMKVTVLRRMSWTSLSRTSGRNWSACLGQAVDRRHVARGLVHPTDEVGIGLTGARLVAARSASPHHARVRDLLFPGG